MSAIHHALVDLSCAACLAVASRKLTNLQDMLIEWRHVMLVPYLADLCINVLWSKVPAKSGSELGVVRLGIHA
jgi:hypothetical protein